MTTATNGVAGDGGDDWGDGPLSGLRVIDGTGGPDAIVTSTLLADLGADVLQLEVEPGGHRARHVGPMTPGGQSLLWKATGRNKRAVAVDPAAASDMAHLQHLLGQTDVLLLDGDDILDPAVVAATHPHLVVLVTTPYGTTGPYAGRAGTSRTAEAFGGQTFAAGEPDRCPLHSGVPIGAGTVAVLGAFALMAAVLERDGNDCSSGGAGVGQVIDLARYEAVFRVMEFLPVFFQRLQFRNERAGAGSSYQVPVGTWQAGDGKWLSFSGNTNDVVHRLYRAMGAAELIDDPRFATNEGRVANRELVEGRITAWISSLPRVDVEAACERERVPIGSVFSIADIFQDANYRARNTIVSVDDDELGPVSVPCPVPGFSRTPGRVRHLGSAKPVEVAAVASSWDGPRRPVLDRAVERSGNRCGPLNGLRVLDIGQILAGPFAATQLADLGADVIKVEKPDGGDDFRRQAPLHDGVSLWWKVSARNKRSITLDLKSDSDRDLLLALVAEADILTENFVPGTLERLGLGYETMRQVNPALVVVSVSGYGQHGPYATRRAFGRNAEAYAGLSYVTGYSDGPPMPSGLAVADCLSALVGVFGALCALYHRRRNPSGGGQHVDVALYETVFRLMEVPAMLYDQLGVVTERSERGSTVGEEWVVERTSDDHWVAASRWVAGPLDAAHHQTSPEASEVRAWICSTSLQDVVGNAAPHGFAVAHIISNEEMTADRHFLARQAIVTVDDTELGRLQLPAVTPRFSRTPGVVVHAAPRLDGDRDAVLRDWAPAAAWAPATGPQQPTRGGPHRE